MVNENSDSAVAAERDLMRGCETLEAAADAWKAEAMTLRATLELVTANRDRLHHAVAPYDDAMGEIFSLCLQHAPENFEILGVPHHKRDTAKDYKVAARNVVQIVEALVEKLPGDHQAVLAKPDLEAALDAARIGGMREAIAAVLRTAAPVQGTPYSVGGRRFAEAIQAQMKLPRQLLNDPETVQSQTRGATPC